MNQPKKLTLALLSARRTDAKRAWEEAKRSGYRGASRPAYEALRAAEAALDAARRASAQ